MKKYEKPATEAVAFEITYALLVESVSTNTGETTNTGVSDEEQDPENALLPEKFWEETPWDKD